MPSLSNTSILGALEVSASLQTRFKVAVQELASLFLLSPDEAPFDVFSNEQRVVLSRLIKQGLDRPQTFTVRVLLQALTQPQLRASLGDLIGVNATSTGLIGVPELTAAVKSAELVSDNDIRLATSLAIPALIQAEIGYIVAEEV